MYNDMKVRIIIFLVAFFMLGSFVCSADLWVKTYDLSGTDEYPLGIDATSDNGVVFSGYIDDGSTRELWVVKLNADGTVGWEQSYDSQISSWYTISRSIEQLSDGSFVVGAEIDNNLADAMILKLSSTGAVQWGHYYGDGNNNQGGTVKATSDGGFISVGTSPTGTPDWAMRVVKTDSAGTIEWENLYYNSGTFNCPEIANSVDELSTGGFVLAGKMLDCTAWIIEIDSTGTVQWQKSFPNASEARCIKEISGGGFIVCGSSGSDAWIAKLNSSGAVVWEKTMGGSYTDGAYSIIELSSGGYVFSGKYGTGSSTFETWIVKLDTSGNITWQKKFAGKEGFGIAEATNGEICVITEVSATIGILRLDGNGEVGVCPTLVDTAVTPSSLTDSSVTTTASTLAFVLADGSLTVSSLSSSAAEADLCSPCDPNITATIDSVTPGTSVCEGTQQTFTGSGTGEGTLTYDWDFDYSGAFNSILSGTSVDYTYTIPGTYTAGLEVSDSCPYPSNQSAIDTVNITVLPAQPVITGPSDSCSGDTILLDGGAGFATYLWSPGGETTQTISPAPSATTTYTVNTTHSNGCSGSDSHTVTIHQPTPVITGLTEICNGDSTTLDSGTGYASYLWSPGGETDQKITVSPSVTTLYSVTVTDGFGCSGTDNHNLIVNDIPQSAPTILTYPTEVCVGQKYTITWSAVSDATGYQVDEFCDDYTQFTGNEYFTTASGIPGFFCFRVRAINDCGNGAYSSSITIFVRSDPAPSITGDSETCQGDPVDLDAGPGFDDYLWSPGGQTTQTISQYISADTEFSVIVHDDLGCVGFDYKNVLYHPSPTPVITGPSEICEGDAPVTLDGGSGYTSYLWSPGGETTQTISVSPSVTTMYEVTVTDSNNCPATATKWLTVNPAPTVPTITESCFYNDIILNAGSGYNSYLWNTGDTTQTLNIGNDILSTYTVTVSDQLGCSSQSSYTASGSCTATKDIYEEDDSCFSSSTTIHDGESQSHDFLDDYDDWLSFNACSGRSYTIETSALGTLCDTVLELYGSDCSTLITSDDNSGTGSASLINWTASANGIYHIRVKQADSTTGSDRSYNITLTGNNSACSSWSITYGGTLDEYSNSIVQTYDGGYVVAGKTESYGSGQSDGWVIKLDSSGSVVWEKVYGGTDWEQFDNVMETTDGGLLLTGRTASWGAGLYDIWIVKVDGSGNIQWQNTYGDSGSNMAYETVEAFDGTFVCAAGSKIIKLNSNGTIAWQKLISSGDFRTVDELADGGFIFGSNSNGYLLKLSASGTIEWQKTVNGSYEVSFHSVCATSDGGFAVAGSGRVTGPADLDFWVSKMDAYGTIDWQYSYGTLLTESAHKISQTSDGGYILSGQSITTVPQDSDLWVLKLSPQGQVQWQKLYDGGYSDYGYASIIESTDGGYTLAANIDPDQSGATGSPVDRFEGTADSLQPFGAGGYDFWVLKMYSYGEIATSCSFVSDSAVTAVSTGATITFPSLSASSDTMLSSTTSATVTTTTATTETQCSGICEPAYAVIETVSPSVSVCLGTAMSFTGSALGVDPVSYEWDFDYDGVSFSTAATGSNASYTYTVPGTYSVALKVSDSCSTPDEDIAVTTVTIFNTPLVAPSDSGPTCMGNLIFFNANPSSGTTPYSFDWNFGDGIGFSTEMNPAYSYNTPGTYTVSCTIIDANSCTSNSTLSGVTITDSFSIFPIGNGQVCEGLPVTFNANPSGGTSPYTFDWDFGDGIGSSSLENPVYTYGGSGTYYPMCIATDVNGCQASDFAPQIVVTANPDVSPANNGPVCDGLPVTFNANPSGGTTPYSFDWDFGDGIGSSSLENPVYTYNTSGNYSASCTVTDLYGCSSSTVSTTVTIRENPSAAPSNNGPGCPGSPVAFTANPLGGTSPYTFNWDFGDGSVASTLENPSYAYSAPGSYTVILTIVDNSDCSGRVSHQALINNTPNSPGNFSLSVACGSIELDWTDSTGETSYRIERDSGTGFALLATLPADSISYSDTTVSDGSVYSYKVAAENGCGTSLFTPQLSQTAITTVYTAPVISNDGEYCNALVLRWTDSYGAESGYIIERNTNASGWQQIDIVPADYEYYDDHDVSEGNSYDYRIMVSNLCGNSSYSNTITMTPDCTVSASTCPTPSVLSSGENISSAPSWVENASIAWNGSHFGIVWSDDRDNSEMKIIFAKMDSSGSLVAGSEKIIGSGTMEHPDIAWNGSQFGVAAIGDLSCVNGGGQLYFFTLDEDGNLTSSQVDLTCNQDYGPNINAKVNWNGSTWGVAWESWSWGDQEVLFQQLDTLAVPQHTDPIQISSSGSSYWSGNPDITSLNGEWYIVWEEEDGTDKEIWYSRRNSDGTEITTSVLTNDTSLNTMVRAAANDSAIGLIWEIDNEPYFRALNPDGTWATSLLQLAVTPDGRDTDIATTGAEWAAIWYEADPYDDPSDIYFQRIDSTGSAIGTALNVTNDIYDSWVPRIAWAGDRWGITYTSNPNWGNSNAHGAVVACGASSSPPSAPLNPNIDEFCEVLTFHWTDTSSNEDNFIVDRSVDGGAFSTVATLSADSHFYLDTNVVASSTYTYKVTATNTDGDGVSDTVSASPLNCSITDLTLDSVVKNPDGTLRFEWSDLSWQIDVDVYRGDLTGTFSYNHNTQIECSYDAQTGYLISATDQITAQPDYYYIIAPNTTDSELYGEDSTGTERPVSGATCP